ncbi:Modification methylase DpnIIB [Gemmata obscuriglobus]|uniref:Methyltransferase n=1 Tax=Gemmata obscuriglobus TaxID=114 RepID=A0A2Z3HA44_9BACT|nr:DNA methyltransferase [Gemmata obscuriglobus]AWM41751.1 site-specific DNA-methyltransferase [Gemmata obscuriglobus]QEG32298.1 Modification methylase DpnIIB [Gemmata obscuriglobus]VTS11654.1 adenine dna methyltransferase : Adenine DNA methyltransferase OS=Mycobacterium abscessus 5S-0708 GN=bpm PE=4 SV=1: Methyltransf_26: N6_N4_Mtase [Gemmata obscuriglobus UQM 2246]
MKIELPTAAEPVRIVQGESLAVLVDLPSEAFDLVLADPPYSSGGFTRGDKISGVRKKYQQTGTRREYPAFAGDTRDQRAYGYWSALWLAQCLRAARPGTICGVFADWRQLPVTVDAIQAGGWVYRGIVPWHKPGARPTQGRFTSSCEYLVWGTKGPRPLEGAPLPGFYSVGVKQADKHHLTGKPTELLRELVKIAPASGLVLDPFAGSFTSAVAAALEGRRCLAIECEAPYVAIGRQRVADALGLAEVPGYLAGDA